MIFKRLRRRFRLAGTGAESVLIALGEEGRAMAVADLLVTLKGLGPEHVMDRVQVHKALYHLNALGLAGGTVAKSNEEALMALRALPKFGEPRTGKPALTYELTEDGQRAFDAYKQVEALVRQLEKNPVLRENKSEIEAEFLKFRRQEYARVFGAQSRKPVRKSKPAPFSTPQGTGCAVNLCEEERATASGGCAQEVGSRRLRAAQASGKPSRTRKRSD